VDDTVTARLREDVSPWEILDLLPHPREVREGQAPHGRDSGPQAGRSRFSLRREEDVDLGRSPSSRPRSRWRAVGCAQGALPRVQGLLRPPYCPRSSRRTTWCLSSSPTEPRVGPGDPRGGGGAPPSGIPPGVYFADLTLGGRVVTVKLLAGTRLRDTRQVPLHDRPLAQRGGGLSGGRSRSSKGRQGPWTPHPGGGGGFRATSRSSP